MKLYRYTHDHTHNPLAEFVGKPVKDYTGEERLVTPARFAWRLADYDSSGDPEVLRHLVERMAMDRRCGEIEALVLGPWSGEETYDTGASVAVDLLLEHREAWPRLRALFVGDLPREWSEISYIMQTNMGSVLAGFPELRVLAAKGQSELGFSNAFHLKLKSLIVHTGGLSPYTLAEIDRSVLPNLEELEIWLGDAYYGGETQASDLVTILSGKAFPRLRRLGLMNCAYGDDLAQALVGSPVVEQIDVLDLSMGTLGDVGARALLACPAIGRLRHLDVSDNYLSATMAAEVRRVFRGEVVTAPQKREGEERYVTVSE